MRALQIQTIELCDYRQYAGTVTIDLQTTQDKHINIIEGQNGAGKSNLLNAVTLCLYGSEDHLDIKDDGGLDRMPMVNRQRMEEVDDHEEASGYVELTLGQDSPEYIFRREFETVKLPDESFNSVAGDLELRQKRGTDWKPIDNPHIVRNEILPTRVKDYFLFDGEDLDGFFDEGYPDRVQKAILDVSHVELLNRSTDHLESVRDEIEDAAPDVDEKVTRLKETYEEEQKELERLQDKKKETNEAIEDAKQSITKIDNKLKDSQDPEVRELQKDRQHKQEKLDEREEQLETAEREARETLVETGPIAYAYSGLEFTHEELAELADRGQLPPKIQDWFVDELIERGECICGADLTDDETRREHLEELKSEMATVSEEHLDGKTELPRLVDDGIEGADILQNHRKTISERTREIEDLKQDLKDISEQLKDYDIPEEVDVSALENQREELQDRIENLREEVGRIKLDIEQQEETVAKAKEEWKTEAEKKRELKEYVTKTEFIEDTHDRITDIKQTILEQIRTETEEKLNSYFNELIWKDETYTVKLDDDYSVRVLGPYDDNKIGSLSAGEKQVLALSFMSALTAISGFNAPIIIDTPLGRISSDPKKRIANNLPGYLEDVQITFLMTDEEYTTEVQARMEDSVANHYTLKFEDMVTDVVTEKARVTSDD